MDVSIAGNVASATTGRNDNRITSIWSIAVINLVEVIIVNVPIASAKRGIY